MFFSENELSLELLGIFKLERTESTTKSNMERNYDSLSIRLEGTGEFRCDGQTVSVKKGDLLYIPKNARYSQKTAGETIIAIHFMNYTYDHSSKIEKLSANHPDFVEQLVRKMYNVWKEKNQGYRYRCTALLYELLYEANCQSVDRSGCELYSQEFQKPADGNIRPGADVRRVPGLFPEIIQAAVRNVTKTIYQCPSSGNSGPAAAEPAVFCRRGF